jgi:hypothetical protein
MKVITANRLLDGDVVWLGENDVRTSSSHSAEERRLPAACTPTCCASPFPMARSTSRQMRQLAMIAEWPMTRATAISPRARTSSSTGRGLKGHAGNPRTAGRCRDARHPDLGQLHPQRHADHFAGAAADEIEDPRPYAEILRQWSTDHPEFQFLPRKFKIAITGAPNDRAPTKVHDIGLQMTRNEAGEIGFEVIVGGGLGRTPMIGKKVRDFLPKRTCCLF